MDRFPQMRFRQVHLDFHTSEHITGVGREFDETQFVSCLKKGYIDSICVFAMCHHGWSYYDTKVGKPHPHLETQLLPRMLKACSENDINAPVYITVGFNELAAREHPDWVIVREDGEPYGPAIKNPKSLRPYGWDGWHLLCNNSPYLDFILQYTKEVMERFNPVGIFYDIVGEYPCMCEYCRNGMTDRGLDYTDSTHRNIYAKEVFTNYLTKTSELIWSMNPSTRIFHNNCTRKMGADDIYAYYSHYEIESLPYWGYDIFPFQARYYWAKDFDYSGMTAKFQKNWGEFGSFKSPTALRHEVDRIIAMGAKCCIGDQLHPSGKMDEDTYRIIGCAYKDVMAKESWCRDVEPVADIGLLSPTALYRENSHNAREMGAFLMLQESHLLFDIIDAESDLSKYRLVILPDCVRISKSLADRLNAYISAGGKLLLSGESGLAQDTDEFLINIGAGYAGKSEWDVDYTAVEDSIAEGLVRSPFLNYEPGCKVSVTDGKVLARAMKPYFNRTMEHFCSHQNTPYDGDAGYPSVLQNGNVIYIAQKIFKMYQQNGLQLHRDLVANCIRLLLPDPILKVGLPSCGKVSMAKFKDRNEYVLHLMYASPVLRGDVQVIEDIPSICNIKVDMNIKEEIKAVALIPEERKLNVERSNGSVSFTVPELSGHQMLLISC